MFVTAITLLSSHLSFPTIQSLHSFLRVFRENNFIKTKKELIYSRKEIGTQLNNSVAFQQQFLENLSAARQTRLRAYAEALIAPTLEHIAEGALTPEEGSFIFSAAALLIFVKTSKVKNIPAKNIAQELVQV